MTPRSSRNQVHRDGEILRARVTAPPVDGQANEALIHLLAKSLRIAPSKVAIVRGETCRDKVVRIEGITNEELKALDSL